MNRLFSAVVFTAIAQSAWAQEGLYWGIGLGYSSMESAPYPSVPQTAVVETAVLGATLGYRFPQAGRLAYSVEGDLDLSQAAFEFEGVPCSDEADAPYYCTHAATLRLRGLAAFELGNGWEAFGSGGLGVVFGTSATDSNVQENAATAGYTVGLGVQGLAGRGTARIEVIYDNFEGTVTNGESYDPTYTATTLKATYLFSF
jgi:Outer membrane protein beta-barrel domain